MAKVKTKEKIEICEGCGAPCEKYQKSGIAQFRFNYDLPNIKISESKTAHKLCRHYDLIGALSNEICNKNLEGVAIS